MKTSKHHIRPVQWNDVRVWVCGYYFFLLISFLSHSRCCVLLVFFILLHSVVYTRLVDVVSTSVFFFSIYIYLCCVAVSSLLMHILVAAQLNAYYYWLGLLRSIVFFSLVRFDHFENNRFRPRTTHQPNGPSDKTFNGPNDLICTTWLNANRESQFKKRKNSQPLTALCEWCTRTHHKCLLKYAQNTRKMMKIIWT